MTMNSRHHPQSRKRRRTLVASVLLLASSIGTFRDVGLYGTGVEAFTAPSPKAILSRNLNTIRDMHTTATRNSLRAIAQSSSQSDADISVLSSSSNKSDIPPGSPLEMICKDQNEFELCVGKAMDTLRDHYPHLLTKNPGKTTTINTQILCLLVIDYKRFADNILSSNSMQTIPFTTPNWKSWIPVVFASMA